MIEAAVICVGSVISLASSDFEVHAVAKIGIDPVGEKRTMGH